MVKHPVSEGCPIMREKQDGRVPRPQSGESHWIPASVTSIANLFQDGCSFREVASHYPAQGHLSQKTTLPLLDHSARPAKWVAGSATRAMVDFVLWCQGSSPGPHTHEANSTTGPHPRPDCFQCQKSPALPPLGTDTGRTEAMGSNP